MKWAAAVMRSWSGSLRTGSIQTSNQALKSGEISVTTSTGRPSRRAWPTRCAFCGRVPHQIRGCGIGVWGDSTQGSRGLVRSQRRAPRTIASGPPPAIVYAKDAGATSW